MNSKEKVDFANFINTHSEKLGDALLSANFSADLSFNIIANIFSSIAAKVILSAVLCRNASFKDAKDECDYVFMQLHASLPQRFNDLLEETIRMAKFKLEFPCDQTLN